MKYNVWLTDHADLYFVPAGIDLRVMGWKFIGTSDEPRLSAACESGKLHRIPMNEERNLFFYVAA